MFVAANVQQPPPFTVVASAREARSQFRPQVAQRNLLPPIGQTASSECNLTKREAFTT